MIGSESARCTVTRGIYKRDDEKGYCPEYDTYSGGKLISGKSMG
ncbi:hypothetical protein [Robinsoniella sp. KNHs210]|nr:hypothetical protein [Robinsoniella sp. KNHs210]